MADGKRKATVPTTEVAKRQRPVNVATVGDYLRYHGGVVRRRVFSVFTRGKVLYEIPEELYQNLTRDVLNRVLTRWENNLPIGSLDIEDVIVEDNAAFIPSLGSSDEDTDYRGKTRSFVVALFGQSDSWEERDDFLGKLSTFSLTRKEYDAIYFHYFLKNREERAIYPAEVVDRFKNKRVMYKGQLMKWEAAYNKWEKLTYPHEKQIDLEAAVKQNEYALKVFKHKTYKASRVSKIKLARNILVHLNDYRERESKPLYTLYELGSLIEEIFPGLGLRIFNFLWDLRLDLDFTKCRNHFKCLS